MICRSSVQRGAQRLALAVGALAILACVEHSDGVAVELGLMHHGTAGKMTDLGYDVSLASGYLVVSRVELLGCEGRTVAGVLKRGLDLLSPVSRARAHGIGSPTALAEPNVVDLLAEQRRTVALGRLEPPAGWYCAVRLTVDAADADAVGLPPTGNLVGRSLFVAGSFAAPAQEPRPFRYGSGALDQVELPFVDGSGKSMRMHLSRPGQTVELRIELEHGAMFDGIPMEAGDVELGAILVMRNLLAGASAVIDDD